MKRNPALRKSCALAIASTLWVAAAHGDGWYAWGGGDAVIGYRAPYGTTQPLDEELLVPVSIWGEVKNPGYYNVPDGADVVRLISYAGGPTEFANLTNVELTRPDSGAEAIDIEHYLDSGDVGAVPVLKPGDTVYVRKNTKYAWREFVTLVSELAVIAGTALLYIEVAGKK